jgi:hypothetical protein
VFENRVLGRILVLQRNEVMEGWIELHIEELHNLYSSPDIKKDQIKANAVSGASSTHGVIRNAYKILVSNPEGKTPLGRRRRWEDNINI